MADQKGEPLSTRVGTWRRLLLVPQGGKPGGRKRRGECGLWCVEGKVLVGGVSEGSLQER